MTATCPLIPTQNYVALRRFELLPPITIILLTKLNHSHFGEVLAVGPDVELVEVGDKLAFRGWTTEVSISGETYVLVSEENLLAKLE